LLIKYIVLVLNHQRQRLCRSLGGGNGGVQSIKRKRLPVHDSNLLTWIDPGLVRRAAHANVGLFFKFDTHRFEGLIAEVLLCVFDWRPPGDVTGFVLYCCHLACRVFGLKILIGEEDGHAIR
jgi:hypothetical protein